MKLLTSASSESLMSGLSGRSSESEVGSSQSEV